MGDGGDVLLPARACPQRRWPRAGALVEPHHGGPLAERAR
jgi:hypothetical protein